MQIALMDPGQVIRPQQIVAPSAPAPGAAIMAPGTPVRRDPNGTARMAARDRILRSQQVADAERVRQQKIEDAIIARRQQLEDEEWRRQIQVEDAAYEDEKNLRDEERKNKRADEIARIKRAEEIADDISKRGRELRDRDDTRKYNEQVLAEQRDYDEKILEAKNKREDEKDKRDWERGAQDRVRQSEKHTQWMAESKARLAEIQERQKQIKIESLFNTKKSYADFLNDVATNKVNSDYRERLDEIINRLSIEEEALQNYAIEKTIGVINNLVDIYLKNGIDDDTDEWLEKLFAQYGMDDVTDIKDKPELVNQIAFNVMSQVTNNPTLLMSIQPLTEVKTAIETATQGQKELVQQQKQFELARSKVSNKTFDEEAVKMLKKAYRMRIGMLGEDPYTQVEDKTQFDENGEPRNLPKESPSEDIEGKSIEQDPPKITKKDTKDFLDDLGNENPADEAIKDATVTDESNSSAVIKPATPDASTFLEASGTDESNSSAVIKPSAGATSFIETEGTDDDNMTEPDDEAKYNSMILNAGSAIGDGVDALGEVIDRSGVGDAASNAISSAADMAISPEGAAITGSLLSTDKGREIIGQAGQTLKDTGRGIANATITPTGPQYATDELKNLQGVLNEGSDDLVEKPVKQTWTDPKTGLPATKGTKGAVPNKVNRLQPEGIANKVNQALGANGSKTFTEPPPAPGGNAKKDLRARAEWQLRLRDHVNTQVQESRKALGVRLKQSVQSMKAKGSRVKGKVPSGVLDFIGNVMKGLVIVEVAYLGQDLVDYLSMEDPKLLGDIKAHEPLEAAREQVQADLNATLAEAQELVQ
jgi:hypothetical protein